MNKTYLLLSIAFVVLVSIAGYLLFNNFFPKSTGVGPERKFFEKTVGLVKIQGELFGTKPVEQIFEEQAVDTNTVTIGDNCKLTPDIIKVSDKEEIVFKNASQVEVSIEFPGYIENHSSYKGNKNEKIASGAEKIIIPIFTEEHLGFYCVLAEPPTVIGRFIKAQ
ncbi:MAG: hypothetical protein Q7S79_02130 [bacterium]|nr:hypothetical protein [bacterium]